MTKNILRVHGPLACECTCSMCDGGHHWMEECVQVEDIDDSAHVDLENLPAVGSPYLPCKHCKAWAEYTLWWHEEAEFEMEDATGQVCADPYKKQENQKVIHNLRTNQIARITDGQPTLRYEDAAKQTTVTGWSCVKCGHFYGDNEHGARTCCYTEGKCEDCDNRRERDELRCTGCATKVKHAKWKAIPQVPWNDREKGSAIVAIDNDTFWFDDDEFLDYCVSNEIRPSDLCPVHTRPDNGPVFSLADTLTDHLPEESDVPVGTDEIDRIVNEFIDKHAPYCWWPDHSARPTDDEIKEWDREYDEAMGKAGDKP